MPRPSVIRAALAGLLTLGVATGPALGAAGAPATRAPAEEPDPLVVHLDTITPVLPSTGDVEITGTVTNVSDETFTRVNLHAFSSQQPILDSPNLNESAGVDPGVYVGPRVTVPGTFDTVDELAPGETASFYDSVPVELLGTSGQAGVYWIGVHALGDGSVPRDDIAEGRARTFIPQEPTGDRTQEASVILPVRSRVWYDADGRVAGLDRWARRLAEGGSLDGVLDMAESAGSTPYSWLVDPAVLHAVAKLTVGNPARSIAPDPSVEGQQPSPTETPTDGVDETPTLETITPATPEPTEDLSEEDAQLIAAADAWLTRFQAIVGSDTVLTLPYGDLDVAAAARNDATRLDQAVDRSAEVMLDLGLTSQPAVSPISDRLSEEAIAATPPGTVILLGDSAFDLPPTSPDSVVRLLGHEVVVTSTGAEAGGPGPTAATDPLALRQRLLSEAALRLENRDTAPLVVTLPTVWNGEDAASFFTDLDQPWLDLVPVSDVAGRSAVDVPASSLNYTEDDLAAELDPTNFSAATRATTAATLLEQVLTLQTMVETSVEDQALVLLSEQHRARPGLARAATDRLDEVLREDLASVRIEGPPAVTLSGDSGPLGATLVNELDQPVTVRVRVSTDGEMNLTGGDGVRELGPLARSVVRFEASTSEVGVHNVRLSVTSVDGVALGSTAQVPIRAARVSALIWVVMAVGALVLFGMVGYRLPGQIRQRRAELAAAEAADEQPEPAEDAPPGEDHADHRDPGDPPVPGEPATSRAADLEDAATDRA
ncbi:DUF6049 family protein [Nocardioides renjunii]|uniref:DUF6049 family protein n=1 Tax=Nocardioides renjunii TaxID=3095075 RepID=UPI002AFE348E|nr:DUF6049 family protein [Nocardioides sp. S-34]WQQ22367.1 DUF6049 family protein [Nocardioides sp. S-34]